MAERESARILRVLRGEIEAVVGRLQLRVLQALTLATPVDTGFARGAWTPSLGGASSGVDRPPPHSHQDRGSPGWQAAAAEAAFRLKRNEAVSRSIASSYQLARGPVYVSNNTPYIGRLNAGSSAQAPARFVEAAIAAAIRASSRG